MQERIPIELFENNSLIKIPEIQPDLQGDFENIRVFIIVMPHLELNEVHEQIHKIFGACKISEEQIYITNAIINWSTIQSQNSIKEVFLFGINPENLGIQYHLFPYKFMNISNKKVIVVDSLDLILGQQQLKSDFWFQTLQPYYIRK